MVSDSAFKARTVLLALLFFVNSPTAWGRAITCFSPATNLQTTDIYWLNKSLHVRRLYIAMYAFTDKPIARELLKLARAGVVIVLYRDSRQMHDRTDVTRMLIGQRNIHIKMKADKGSSNIMHDKLFIIPGVVFREGSANWSPSGEGANSSHGKSGRNKQQDNNATYITNPGAIKAAVQNFIHIWRRKSNIPVH